MQTGRKCTLNYNTGTFASPTWAALGRVSSPSRSQGRPTSRRVYREANTSKNATGVIDREITFTYVAKDAGVADSVLDDILDSFINETVLDIAMLDDDAATVGAVGIRGPFVVTQADRSEGDEESVIFECTLVEVESADQESDEFEITA
jgi:hypothetical protein